MLIKENIVEHLMKCGYDFFTACEEATRVIKEIIKNGGEHTYYCRKCNRSITLAKEETSK